MKVDDRQIARICMVGFAISLAAIYVIILQMEPQVVEVGEVTGLFSGKTVSVAGQVSSLYFHKSGHIFFNLMDGKDRLRVVVWENIVEQLRYSGTDLTTLKNGDSVQVTGTVEMYKGEPEIVPVRAQVKIV
jgi:DNA/RNA endonuclease YhcR with UshA esterase domain